MKMQLFWCWAAVWILLVSSASSRSTPEEESVVSNYTSSSKLDVYQQIAHNIAQRITSPIYRFFGIETKNKTTTQTQSKRNFNKIEILDDPEDPKPLDPVSNDIGSTRDVEELSVEALKKKEKKPEKITLYSYLPVKSENDEINEGNSMFNDVEVKFNELDSEVNETINEVNSTADDDDFDFDFDEEEEPREGAVYFLEWIGSIIQLAWGAFVALFRPSS